MLVARLRRHYADLVTSGSQLGLLAVGFHLGSRPGWFACLGLIALISLAAWVSAYQRSRAISDTPTSRIASAAQGYVELHGSGRALAGLPVLSPLTQLPCLWYRYKVEQRRDNKWVAHDSGESDASFLLDDGSAQCLVDPEGAEILCRHHEIWQKDDYRYQQWLLLERDRIVAIGQFKTRGSVDLELNAREDMKALLAEWKARPQELLTRFDLDGNGHIDLREWELARAQARREVEAAHREARAHVDLHTLRAPDDGRPYLLSNIEPERLRRRYRLWAFAHLAFFFAALGGVGWTLKAAL